MEVVHVFTSEESPTQNRERKSAAHHENRDQKEERGNLNRGQKSKVENTRKKSYSAQIAHITTACIDLKYKCAYSLVILCIVLLDIIVRRAEQLTKELGLPAEPAATVNASLSHV